MQHVLSTQTRRASLALLALAAGPALAAAQLVLPKTVPVAQGDQFMIFPSRNAAMGGISIAVADSLLDPFVNPAKASRISGTRLHGAPLLYDISGRDGVGDAGGARTIPLGMVSSRGAWSGGLVLALQQLDKGERPGTESARIAERYDVNEYAAAVLARRLPGGVSLGANVFWGGLAAVDGVDLLYGFNDRVEQSGQTVDLRLGLTKEWAGGSALELLLLHDRIDMTHDVHRTVWRFDPIARIPIRTEATEVNQDRTHTWGVHTTYVRPVGSNGWRLGWLATANRHSHPKIPNYEIMSIPRDPGTTWAWNAGMGIARLAGPLTFGLDVVWEPITSETWADAARDTARVGGGTIAKGARTVDNRFRFNDAILRLGVGRDAALGAEGEGKSLGVQFGVAMRSIDYTLRQTNHVTATSRRQREHWIEWTPTWGLTFRFPELTLAYSGRTTTGVGRPGTAWIVSPLADAATGSTRGGGIIVAPGAPLALTDVRVVQHQVSFALPVR